MMLSRAFLMVTNNHIRKYVLWGVIWACPLGWAGAATDQQDFVLRHVQDAHDWHLTTIGRIHVTIPLPIILYEVGEGWTVFSSRRFSDNGGRPTAYRGYYLNDRDKIVSLREHCVFYDLSLTKNAVAMLVSVVMMLGIFILAARRYRRQPDVSPTGFWAILELLILFVRDDVAVPNIGRISYQRFMPYLLSMFFFIWLNNFLGLLPGAANVTGNISVTLVLALFTFIMTNFHGNKQYWAHVFKTPGVPRWLSPIMIPVELVGLFTKPISLMIRLFANITAGHIILLSIIGLIFSLENAWASILIVPLSASIVLLKLFVAFLQAYIFTLLSAIYLGTAVADTSHKKPSS